MPSLPEMSYTILSYPSPYLARVPSRPTRSASGRIQQPCRPQLPHQPLPAPCSPSVRPERTERVTVPSGFRISSTSPGGALAEDSAGTFRAQIRRIASRVVLRGACDQTTGTTMRNQIQTENRNSKATPHRSCWRAAFCTARIYRQEGDSDFYSTLALPASALLGVGRDPRLLRRDRPREDLVRFQLHVLQSEAGSSLTGISK